MTQLIKILSIDDNEIDREVIHRALSKSEIKFYLVETDSVIKAKALMLKQKFDCLLLDDLIPPTNGVEFLKSISSLQDMPAVVMLTGMGNENVAIKVMKHSANEYIQKSNIDTKTITNAIQNALAAKQTIEKNKLHHLELEQMSFYDSLTGLANRNLLMNRLSELVKSAKRYNKKFNLMLMDLDGFKAVNDNLGYAMGDAVLKQISIRLLEASRTSDTVARLGGDEFVILLPDTADDIGAATLARKFIDKIKLPIEYYGETLTISASIGIATFPNHATDSHTLIQKADLAMYHAKKGGKGFTVYHDNSNDKRATQISTELPDILNNKNMIMHYQPKIKLNTGKFCGAEVLVRWQHPELGLLAPHEFIPVAEKCNVIRELSYKLIERVGIQQKSWEDEGINIPLSINLSGAMLTDHDLVSKIEQIINRINVSSELVTFEITESALITDPRRARKSLERLAISGYTISIDDFGTGFSSLTYLRDFPIHEIKIDKSFVQSINHDERNIYIIEAIVNLSQATGAVTVAEGIEDYSTWKQIEAMGCDIGQGYYFSKPICAKEFKKWVQQWELHKTPAILLHKAGTA